MIRRRTKNGVYDFGIGILLKEEVTDEKVNFLLGLIGVSLITASTGAFALRNVAFAIRSSIKSVTTRVK